ncbi:MAG: hypothetical protein ABJD13_03900 [Paracoccaceae bacterium]
MERTKLFFEILAAIAVIGATLLAAWELVVKDRERERLVSQNTIELIELDLSEVLVNSRSSFIKEFLDRELDTKTQFSRDDATAIEVALLPQLRYFAAWETCIATELCDVETGKTYICTRATAYFEILTMSANALGSVQNPINGHVLSLLERCNGDTI